MTKSFTARLMLCGAATGILLSSSIQARPAAASATEDIARELGALEDASFAAWKARDTKFWVAVLSKRFVGWGPTGRIDAAAALPMLSGASCVIAGYRLTSPQVTRLTPAVAVVTHRTEVDGACSQRRLPPESYTLSAYVRESRRWKLAYRAQSAIVDPMKATRPGASEAWSSGATQTDAATQTLLAREHAVVNAWKDRDGKRMAALFGPELQFVDIFGNHIESRVAALKAWSGEGCDVKSFTFTGAKATMFTPDFGILTYRASYNAKCFGQDVWPIWGTALYVKRGTDWMWSSGINVLAGAPAD